MVKSHVRLWLIAIFLMLFVMPAIISPGLARSRLESEFNSSTDIFGAERVSAIVGRANSIYETIIGGLGIDKIIATGYVQDKDVKNTIAEGVNRAGSSFTNSYLQSMALLIYGIFFRGSLMIQWLAYIGSFLVGAFVDGLVQRRIKRDLIHVNNPILFSLTAHTLILITFAPIAYLLMPFAVTPWFMPVWTVVMAFPLAKAVAHAVKVK